ncbi:MAG: TRAP transporter small permease subunit [Betaproteobacteria bacterium]|nr:TRAP transporter small permease subunit [Betaproteobacteria bacterium]
MNALLKISRLIDALNEKIGLIANWLVLAACAISAGNALMRYGFSLSSNAWLEIQWYLFAGIVMLGASHTLRVNEHVRVDVFYSRYSERARLWLDLLGGILFLLPMAAIIGWLSWPLFLNSYQVGEVSPNAGGLLRWPVKVLIPLGFLLLTLQGISEIIKRAAALTGHLRLDGHYERPPQ